MFRIPSFSVAALALFAAAFARAAPLVLDTPTNVTQCATTFVSWCGGIRVSLVLHPVRPSPTVPRLTPPQHPTSSCVHPLLRTETPLTRIRTLISTRLASSHRTCPVYEYEIRSARALKRDSEHDIRADANFFNSLNTSAPAGGTIGVGIQNTSIAWTVAEPAGQDLFLLLTDSGTSTAESSRIVVGPSDDASCLG
ncbi:hypothetical protein K488DRAFT_85361 [Vararia minispora EC-137]|uniref:Uncharacterized protein n=1 Tax=Vararia minispora EC-137 TaxID=1314806 RepID=A0ACB8QNF0_9AGAM|nr:hypothetical protein K488DRAFT_85361 [Vararia minispora EC-137]